MPRTATLDQIKRHEICALLACGASRRQAAEYVGCAVTTIANTARHDADFAERLWQAECNYALRNLRAINRAAGRSWRAAVWALREHDPGEFGANRERNVPPASVARAAARETAVRVPASAGGRPTDDGKPTFSSGSERPATQPNVLNATTRLADASSYGRPAAVVGHKPPCRPVVVGQKPPVRGSTPTPVSERPATLPMAHTHNRGDQIHRPTSAGYTTALLWTAAIVAWLVLGQFQRVFPALPDGPPFGDGASDLNSPVQPPSASVRHTDN